MPSGCDPVRSATTVTGPAAPFSSMGTRTTRRAPDSTTSSASPSAFRQQPFGNAGTASVHTVVSPPGDDAEQQPVVRAPLARVGHVERAVSSNAAKFGTRSGCSAVPLE